MFSRSKNKLYLLTREYSNTFLSQRADLKEMKLHEYSQSIVLENFNQGKLSKSDLDRSMFGSLIDSLYGLRHLGTWKSVFTKGFKFALNFVLGHTKRIVPKTSESSFRQFKQLPHWFLQPNISVTHEEDV